MTRTTAVLLLLAMAAAALAARLWRLDERPMHPDEANQAVRAGLLQSTGEYRYDPAEHHGPTLYYLALPGAWLTAGRDFAGTREATFRAVPAVFGAGLILLGLLVRGTLGEGPVLAGGLFAAISPAMVYFSRFFIQEMLLVFFTFGFIAAAWRYLQRPGPGWAAWAGCFAALMFATKETCVLAWAALAGAVVIAGWLSPAWRAQVPWRGMTWRHLGIALLAGGAVAVTFFSSFFSHWQGLRDAAAAYLTYAGRGAGGAGTHNHPWHFYLQRLAWFRGGPGPVFSEGFILILAIAGGTAAWRMRRSGRPGTVLTLLLACYSLLLSGLYSAISYKTPWCALSFLHGMIVVAGCGAAALVRFARGPLVRAVVLVVLAAGVVQLGRQAWRVNTRFAADPRNPWCYAHTSPDLLNFAKRVDGIAAVHPAGKGMPIAVVEKPENYWPIPWYLRKYPNTGYWEQMQEMPDGFNPALVVTGTEQATPLDGNSQAEYFGLRPDVLLALHIRKDLWEQFLATRVRAGR